MTKMNPSKNSEVHSKNDAQVVLKTMLTVFKILYNLALCAIFIFCYYHTWSVTKDIIGLTGMNILMLLLGTEVDRKLTLDNENAELKKKLEDLKKNA